MSRRLVSDLSDRFLARVSAVTFAALVAALVLGLPGAADLGPARTLVDWLGLSLPVALLGVLLVHRSRSEGAVAPAGRRPEALVRLVAGTWGGFRLVGSTVTAVFALLPGLTWQSGRDALVLAGLAVSGAGLAAAALRAPTRGFTPVLAWCGTGLVLAALGGVAATAAGSALAAAVLLMTAARPGAEVG